MYPEDSADMAQKKLEILGKLIELLKTDEIDLVILNTASLPLAARIIESKIILVDKKPFLRHAFESLTLRKYFDFSKKEMDILERRYKVGLQAAHLEKTRELDEYLNQIGELSSIAHEKYSHNWKAQRIVERTLQMMIETCTDVANHIISDRGYRVPKNYGDTFQGLYENGVLVKDLFETMSKMVKFRNIVVHQYDKVDETIVMGILRKNLADFVAYRDAILKILG